MDLSPFLALLPIALLSLVFFFSTGRKATLSHGDGRRSLPPSPSGFPLVGHLPLLGSLPHRTLRAMAGTHGPVMLLRLGRVPIVVASSAAAAQEAMKARDVAFAGRYRGPMVERLFYGCDMAFAPYGEHWRQARRVCVLHLLSQRCVLSFRRVRQQETAALLDRVRGAGLDDAVNLSHLLVVYSSVVLLRAAFGNDSSYGLDGEGKILRKLLVDVEELLGLGTLGEVVPWLAWVDSMRGVHAKATRTFNALDGFLERGIADHRTRCRGDRREGDGGDDDSRRSFVSVLMDVKEEEAGGILFDTVAVKAIILDMFLAGSSTTASIVEWAMAELINHPDEMRMLQEEIHMVIHGGGDNQVTEDHLSKLRHLKPVVKETLSLHMPSPLVLRETMEDTELLGYHVPACTRVIIDVGAISQDPATWERAEEFLLERWFGDDGGPLAAVAGHDFTFLPFGGGRRGCPGAGFGMASVDLVLTSLLYHFDWELPASGASTVNMDEVGGLAMRLKKPLRLVAKPWSP
ncbi:unnamed protein product [Miscanthus lutarioriparius]|uniref:Uncharacterized protein n=1 Tax=Miscanthus lutarioriparius TaxID=422564 RepID=A0A811RI73_9POAL|nr:unnamed protein product [Miscanthus lutarioriparius]